MTGGRPPEREPSEEALRTRRCGCGAEDCTATVWVSWEEQDAVDHADRLWIVAPGHPLRGAARQRVIETNDRFSVVHAVEQHEDEVGGASRVE